MKTIKRKFYYIAAVLSLIFTLSSCEYVGMGIEIGNGTNSYHESTDYLCSRIWTDEWTDEYGVYYYQEICFYPNNTGVDYLYSQDRYGNRQESSLNFGWDWWDSNYTSIRLNYDNRYSYMENIAMGGNQLNCLLDGYPAYFIGK